MEGGDQARGARRVAVCCATEPSSPAHPPRLCRPAQGPVFAVADLGVGGPMNFWAMGEGERKRWLDDGLHLTQQVGPGSAHAFVCDGAAGGALRCTL